MKASLFLKLGRVSNLPTVAGNVFLGAIFAGWDSREDSWPSLILLTISMLTFYIAGMFQNDYMDRHIDRLREKGRPLVTGETTDREVLRITSGLFLLALLLASGSVLLAREAPPGISLLSIAFLAGVISLYNQFHRGTLFASVLMGLSRVAVYTTSFVVFGGMRFFENPVPVLPGGVPAEAGKAILFLLFVVFAFLYVTLLTLFARKEAPDEKGGRGHLFALLILSATTLLLPLHPAFPISGFLPAIGFALWTGHLAFRFQKKGRVATGPTITGLIAGIALLDGTFAALIQGWSSFLLYGGLFLFTLFWQRFIQGT